MVDPEEAVERLRTAFGGPDGHRTLHAKGGFHSGTFTATPEAAALCRAGHLAGQPVPVTVRWSNAGGNARVGDHRADIRGMAVSFRLADGTATDLLGQTAPRFPVRTPEDFLAMTEAATSPLRLPLFLARHPGALPALLANARARAVAPPHSYAEASYYPIHAYRWLAADGTGRWVRYAFVPLAGPADRVDEEFTGRDRLQQEIEARLARGPVEYDVRVSVAGSGDDPHDPMSVWKRHTELSAGRLRVVEAQPDPETDGAVVVFDPTRVVDGIELSDDPLLRFRPLVYSASVSRRMQPRE